MAYTFNAWATTSEDPVGAAMRANATAERRVADAAFDYHSALSRGNAAEVAAAKQSFRQAWETDVRRKGGHPEEFIPNYPGVDPVPLPPYGFFLGQAPNRISVSSPIINLMGTAAILYILWMFLA